MGSKLGLCLVLAGVLYFTPAWAEDTAASTSVIRVEKSQGSRWFKPENLKYDWKFDLGAGNTQEGKDTWSGGYTWIDAKLDYKFIDELKVHAEPTARFYGGRAQERYDDDVTDSRIGFNDAHISFQPWSVVELKSGLHSQRVLENNMLVSKWRGFQGFQEILKAKAGEFEGRVVLQQVIPNSHSLNTEREKQESLPWFRTEHIELSGKHWNAMKWKAKGGLYEWNDIPAKVAFESIRQGNTPASTITVANSRFAYSHQGWLGGLEACYCDDSPVGFSFGYDRIHNLRAPGDSADAQSWGFGPTIKWKNYSFDFRYKNYFIESDATVAAYNSGRLGGTNRIGDMLSAKLDFKKYGFALYGEMYKSKPINNLGTEQRSSEQYYFGLETDYATE